jgi:arylsulfatase A-like enzyme
MPTLSRRDFMKTSVLATSMPALAAKKQSRKPNVLFIWTDEQRADTMAVYGNHKIHAPNLNKLAEESVVFERAYVSQPVCTPSRSTVMSGQWPHQNGCTQNNIALAPKVAAFPEIVNDPDYRTSYIGKWHLGDEIYPQHGFQEWRSMEDGYSKYYGDHRDLQDRSTYHAFLDKLGYKPDTSQAQFSRGFAANLPIEHCKPKYLELEACDFMSRHQNEPFMLYINFLEPHMPFHGPLDDEHDPKEVDLPDNYDDPLEDNEPKEYHEKRKAARDREVGGLNLKTEAGWRRLIANYWGLVTQVDRSVGAILKKLDDLGLADDTIVVYTSDHGDMMGSHQMLAKTVMYEEAVRVPWLMRLPKQRKQIRVPHPVSQIDLVPTLLDAMGLNAANLPGNSLLPTLDGAKPEEDHVFIEWSPVEAYPKGRNPYGATRTPDPKGNAVRTVVAPDGWKLSIHTNDHNQLFNLNTDPGERINVFDQPENKAVIQRLTAKIQAWQAKSGDTLTL